uniref:RNase H domain-containing protein n=1 Tax=Strongyloides venezuelensis TaxID=75913 RepID=A0A0K0FS44_STRVS
MLEWPIYKESKNNINKNLLMENITDKTFVDEKIKELENVKIIAASDGSSGKDSLGKATLIEVRIHNNIYLLQGSLEGRKVYHLERNLTHMDMELEALLFNAIITDNIPAVCIVDSEALIPMWENLMNMDPSEELRSRRRRILEIIKQCGLKKTSIMWLPRNSITLMDKVDNLAKNA